MVLLGVKFFLHDFILLTRWLLWFYRGGLHLQGTLSRGWVCAFLILFGFSLHLLLLPLVEELLSEFIHGNPKCVGHLFRPFRSNHLWL